MGAFYPTRTIHTLRDKPMKETATAHILLIEDNPADEELALHALKEVKPDHQITVVRDGEEAVRYLFGEGGERGQSHPGPDLILLDLKLPKINGLEVLKKIKTDQNTSTIPVVVLTSSNQKQDIIRSYRLGANSYITKPVDFETFSSTIQDIVRYWLSLNRPPSV